MGIANAQSRQIPAPPQNRPIIIHNAAIHPVSSETIEHGYVIFEEGRITAVGRGRPPVMPAALAVDGQDMHLYPGLIAADTDLGLTEIGAVDVTNDQTEFGRVKPEVRAAVAVNPDSDLIPVARANGVLTALLQPDGGLVSGRGSIIRLDGWTWEDMAIEPDAGLVVRWPRTEPITAWWMERSEEDQRKEIREDLQAIEKVFDDALAYIKARDNDPAVAVDMRYEAMRPMLSGPVEERKPLFLHAALAGQIESAVAWAQRRGLKIVIVGGDQADRAAALLKQHDIPVIIGGTHRMPTRRHDPYDQAFALPAKLHEAGVRFCIASGAGASNERNLNHAAATAAAYGLPRDEALKAVTLSAAQIIGVGKTHGSIEVGKAATLILATGDPLEITTDVVTAFIDGRRIDLGSRHKSLNDKYREKYRQLEANRTE